MSIAKYVASVSVQVDQAAIKSVDNYLKKIEKRMRAFQKKAMQTNGAFNIKFSVNEQSLARTVGNALDRASSKVTMEIKNFHINQMALNRSLGSALDRTSGRVSVNAHKGMGSISPEEWSRRTAEQHRNRMELAQAGGHTRKHNGLYGLGGQFGPYALGAGAFYGMAALNRGGQELQANKLALSAAAGSDEKGAYYDKYLSNLGDKLGKTTRTMSPFFSQMLAGSKGTSLEPHLESGFESLMKYSSVMGLDDQKIKGTIRAFTQMIGKQQIMAEELRGQAAEHLPPIVRLMADVAAGGDMKKLNKMMKAGQLDPNIHLPLLFKKLDEESAPYMDKYFSGSRFAQGKMQKGAEDQLRVFSDNGGTQGFTNFFNTMSTLLKSSEPLIKGLAGAFENLTASMKPAADVFGQFTEVLKEIGVVSGTSEKQLTTLALVGGLMMTKWGRIAMVFNGLFLILQDISYGMQGKDSYTKDFMDWANMTSPLEQGLFGVSAALAAVSASLIALNTSALLPGIVGMFGGASKVGWGAGLLPLLTKAAIPIAVAGGLYAGGEALIGDDVRTSRGLWDTARSPTSPLYGNENNRRQAFEDTTNPEHPYYRNPEGWNARRGEIAREETLQYMQDNLSSGRTQLPGITKMDMSVKVEANITAENAEDFSQKFQLKIQDMFSQALHDANQTE